MPRLRQDRQAVIAPLFVLLPIGGGFRKLSGNELGCLLLDYILGTMQKAGTLPADPVAVRSIVSTPMADKIAASYGVKMRRVLTGFKYIGDIITSSSALRRAAATSRERMPAIRTPSLPPC